MSKRVWNPKGGLVCFLLVRISHFYEGWYTAWIPVPPVIPCFSPGVNQLYGERIMKWPLQERCALDRLTWIPTIDYTICRSQVSSHNSVRSLFRVFIRSLPRSAWLRGAARGQGGSGYVIGPAASSGRICVQFEQREDQSEKPGPGGQGMESISLEGPGSVWRVQDQSGGSRMVDS